MTPAEGSAPTRLRAEHLDDPIGIDVRRPRLSWWLPEGVTEQEAYQLRVDGVELDRVESNEHVLVPWPADDLVSGQRLTWQVRVWSDGSPTDWSAPAVVEAGLLDPSDWVASWIEPDERGDPGEPGRRPAPVLRHEFVLDRPVERARLYATAHGVYEAFLGGSRVGDLELTPGTTSYPHRLQVQTHDVAALLHEGRNELRVVLSDGWWRGQTGNGRDHDCYGTTLAFLGQLHVDHPDGSRTVVVTDPSWTWTTGPIRGADLMAGQTVDLRIPLEGWAPVTVVDHGVANLCASPAPPMRRIEELRPVAVTEPVPGHQVVDLGQNINGWVRLRRPRSRRHRGDPDPRRGPRRPGGRHHRPPALGRPHDRRAPGRDPGRPGGGRAGARRGVRAPPHQPRLPVRAGRGPGPSPGARRRDRGGRPHGPAPDGLVPLQRRAHQPAARRRGVELPGQRLRHPHRLPATGALGLDRRLAAVRAHRGLPLRRRRLLAEVAPGPARPSSGPTASSSTSPPSPAGRRSGTTRSPGSSRARPAGATPR